MGSGRWRATTGSSDASAASNGEATSRRGKRKTCEPFTTKAVLSQPTPSGSRVAGASAGNWLSISSMARAGVTTSSGFQAGVASAGSGTDPAAGVGRRGALAARTTAAGRGGIREPAATGPAARATASRWLPNAAGSVSGADGSTSQSRNLTRVMLAAHDASKGAPSGP
jgi:hypothetical protein